MLGYRSLREKLVQPFLLFGFAVSASLSLITFALLAQIEEAAIERALRAELESFRHRLERLPAASPASGTLLRGHFLPDPSLPSLRPLPPGEERLEIRILDDHQYSVLITEAGKRPFALLYERAYIQDNLQQLALLLLITTAAISFLSFLVGYRLSRTVLKPIVRLLHEVTQQAEQATPEQQPATFAASDYPDDEIGQLVRQLDRFSLRLYHFIQRESYFSADVSHELRTPISVILGAAEVLAEIPDTPAAVCERIELIRRQASRMGQILEAMLLLGRETPSDHDPVCRIAEVVNDVIADSRQLLSPAVTLTAHVEGQPTLPVERSLIHVVISNLLRNAITHTREGRIDVVADDAGLTLRDTGIGMPKERFSEFLKRHEKGHGSHGFGLGLSIVSRICERQHWAISCSSTPDHGTEIRIHFRPAD